MNFYESRVVTGEAAQQTDSEYISPAEHYALMTDLKTIELHVRLKDKHAKEILEDLSLKNRSLEMAVSERNKERAANIEFRIEKQILTANLNTALEKVEETEATLNEEQNKVFVLEAEKVRLIETHKAYELKNDRLMKGFKTMRSNLIEMQRAKTVLEDQLVKIFKRFGLKHKQMRPTELVNKHRPNSSSRKKAEQSELRRNKSREELPEYEEIEDFIYFNLKKKVELSETHSEEDSKFPSEDYSEVHSEDYSEVFGEDEDRVKSSAKSNHKLKASEGDHKSRMKEGHYDNKRAGKSYEDIELVECKEQQIRTVINEHGEVVTVIDQEQDTKHLQLTAVHYYSKSVQFDCDDPEIEYAQDGTANTKDGRSRFYLPFNPNVVFGLKGDVFYQSLFKVFQPVSKVPDGLAFYLPPYKLDEGSSPLSKPPRIKRSPKKTVHSESCGVNCKHLNKHVRPKVRDDNVLVLKKQELEI
jgi:hypothetical protein